MIRSLSAFSLQSLFSLCLFVLMVTTVETAATDQYATINLAQSSDTCSFSGQVFQRGESYGDSFVTRCGSAADFPCYCNPDLSPPIECNYCSFALQGGGLSCARDEEMVRFTDLKGVDQTCSCQASGGMNPSAECTIGMVDDSTSDNNNNDDNDSVSGNNNDQTVDNDNNTDNDTDNVVIDDGNNKDDLNDSSCLVILPSGAEKIVPNGNYIYEGEKANICGDDYPCFCNEGQVECPYCTFNAIDDDVVCARDKESVIFEGSDFNVRSCTCQLNVNSTDGNAFSSDCVELTSAPSVAPTAEPTADPFLIADMDCEIKDGKGNIVRIEHGASFGSLVQGKCGSAEDWPSFCNKQSSPTFSRNSLQDDVEYPYCVFDNTYSGDTVCARDNEEVTFLDNNGFLLACRCRAPIGYGQGGMTTCRDASEQETSFTWSPTEAPKVDVASATTMPLMAVATVTIMISLLQVA
ncbi:unnamed protein product [Cylindrotheca closterium]|uniref:Uncharacterized protein n=1 Tax=Cylindrotheca closterium TaxID=2856 RepID=A0AAD2CE04_9STRA|nr:unnamed protein product [Cylindrotheca closterium]